MRERAGGGMLCPMPDLTRCAIHALATPERADHRMLLVRAVAELVASDVFSVATGTRRAGLFKKVPVPVLVPTGKPAPAREPLPYVAESILAFPEEQHGEAKGRSAFDWATRAHKKGHDDETWKRCLGELRRQDLLTEVERPKQGRVVYVGGAPPMTVPSPAGQRVLDAAATWPPLLPRPVDEPLHVAVVEGWMAGLRRQGEGHRKYEYPGP